MKKYGRTWERVEDNHPISDTSWLVVSIGYDQVWFDDVSGLLYLREGQYAPLWYKCEYNW